MTFEIGQSVKLKHDSLIDTSIMTGGRMRLRPIETDEEVQLPAGTALKVVDLMDAKKVSPNMGVLHPVVEIDEDSPWVVVACYDVEA